MSKLIAYTDGSYNKKIHKCAYGVIVLDTSNSIIATLGNIIDDIYYCNMRNVGGEIVAAEMAMKYALENKCDDLDIYYDYIGIAGWTVGIGKSIWKSNNRCTAHYKEVYEEISKSLNINFCKVKSHSDDYFNDMVDELAKKCALIE